MMVNRMASWHRDGFVQQIADSKMKIGFTVESKFLLLLGLRDMQVGLHRDLSRATYSVHGMNYGVSIDGAGEKS